MIKMVKYLLEKLENDIVLESFELTQIKFDYFLMLLRSNLFYENFDY
jgi:hypothetical protein